MLTLTQPVNIKIICPNCNQSTEIAILKTLNKEEYKDEIDEAMSDTSDMIRPEFTKIEYEIFRDRVKDKFDTDYIIGRINRHKIGLFKKTCPSSERTFKILFYYIVDHDKKLGGSTFRIGKEVFYIVEFLEQAEALSKKYPILKKESICIIISSFWEQFVRIEGQNMDLWDALHSKSDFVIGAHSTSMNAKQVSEFIMMLATKLKMNGEEVRVSELRPSGFVIECLKDEKWHTCVGITPKDFNPDEL